MGTVAIARNRKGDPLNQFKQNNKRQHSPFFMDDEIEEDEGIVSSIEGWFWLIVIATFIGGVIGIILGIFVGAFEILGVSSDTFLGILFGASAILIAASLTYGGRDENDNPVKHYLILFFLWYLGIEMILLTFGYSLSPYGPME